MERPEGDLLNCGRKLAASVWGCQRNRDVLSDAPKTLLLPLPGQIFWEALGESIAGQVERTASGLNNISMTPKLG